MTLETISYPTEVTDQHGDWAVEAGRYVQMVGWYYTGLSSQNAWTQVITGINVVNLSFYPHLWSQTLFGDWKNEVVDTGIINEWLGSLLEIRSRAQSFRRHSGVEVLLLHTAKSHLRWARCHTMRRPRDMLERLYLSAGLGMPWCPHG